MPTDFPTSNDVFTEPSAPASTPLGDAGDSTRNSFEFHKDVGDAIMAMQAEATLAAHSHNGSTFRHGSKLTQANTHENADTDLSPSSIHHTIGTGENQGAAANHTHGAAVIWPVGSIFITVVSGNPASSPHNLPGTWTAVEGCFIVAAGSTFTAGSTGGGTSHTHTVTHGTTGAHSHTSGDSSTGGSHSHAGAGSSGSSNFSHRHTWGSTSVSSGIRPHGSGIGVASSSSHSHTGNSSSNDSSHSHSINSSSSGGDHFHTIPGSDSQGSHTHTSSFTTSDHFPPYLVVYVWERTA